MRMHIISYFALYGALVAVIKAVWTDPNVPFLIKTRQDEIGLWQKEHVLPPLDTIKANEEQQQYYITDILNDNVMERRLAIMESSHIEDLGMLAYYALSNNNALENCIALHHNIYGCISYYEGYVILVYRPLLLKDKLQPAALRYLYHSLAQQTYKLVANFVTQNLGRYNTVLLVAGVEAGLHSQYHALGLIRKHPILGPLGNHVNSKGLVQVLTFNSPPSFTAANAEYFSLNPVHYINFQTFVSRVDSDFASIGRTVHCSLRISEYKHKATDNDITEKLFLGQNLEKMYRTGQMGDLVTGYITQNLGAILASQKDEVYIAITSASSKWNEERAYLLHEDLHECVASLEQTIQNSIKIKYKNAEKYKLAHGIASNWSLSKPLPECNGVVIGKEYKALCYLNMKQFAEYRIILENNILEDDNDATAHDAESITIYQTDTMFSHLCASKDDEIIEDYCPSEHRSIFTLSDTSMEQMKKGFTECLCDLFKSYPSLDSFSPFRYEPLSLHYSKHGGAVKKCTAKIVSSIDRFWNMYNSDKPMFLQLMTAPDRPNPESCQRNTLPVRVKEEDDSHWDKFLSSSREFNVEMIMETGHECSSTKVNQLWVSLLSFLKAKLEKRPQSSQFDCTKPQTLWHSPHFCPEMCRILHKFGFCERLYIDRSGLKVSLRGDNSYLSNWGMNMVPIMKTLVDPSYRDLQMLSIMKTQYDDWAVYGLNLQGKERNYYLVVFLEGAIYQEFKTLHQKYQIPQSPSNISQ